MPARSFLMSGGTGEPVSRKYSRMWLMTSSVLFRVGSTSTKRKSRTFSSGSAMAAFMSIPAHRRLSNTAGCSFSISRKISSPFAKTSS